MARLRCTETRAQSRAYFPRLVLVLFVSIASAATEDDIATRAGFEQVFPGLFSGAACGLGGQYSWYFRAGTANKLVIEFEGGGACWSKETCGFEVPPDNIPIWNETVGDAPPEVGLRDKRSENTVRDWDYLFIPYCTGDVHIGEGGVDGIRFNGRRNARTALEWIYKTVPSPTEVLVVGYSAGSLGAAVWAPWIADQYRGATRRTYFGDSFVGVTAEKQWTDLNGNWGLYSALFPAPGLEKEIVTTWKQNVAQYILATTAQNFGPEGDFPRMDFVQFTHANDIGQIAYTWVSGGPFLRWSQIMRENFQIVVPQQNAGYYIGAGVEHTIINGDGFFEMETDGVTLHDWLAAVISGDSYQQAIDCCAEENDGNERAAVSRESTSCIEAFGLRHKVNLSVAELFGEEAAVRAHESVRCSDSAVPSGTDHMLTSLHGKLGTDLQREEQ